MKAQDLRPGDRIGEWLLVEVFVSASLPTAMVKSVIATWQRTDTHTHTLEVCRRWYEWDENVPGVLRASEPGLVAE